MTLVLASGSPRRRELLSRFGLPFTVVPGRTVERAPTPGEDPAAYATALAREKVMEVARRHSDNAVILGADTVVAVDGAILGKPADASEAVRMLTMLRGRTHTVVTSVVVRCGTDHTGSVAAEVVMRDFSDAELQHYVATGEPMDKAGAYAVQGWGGQLVAAVKGCRETVIGLPLCLTYELLHRCGLLEEVPVSACCNHDEEKPSCKIR
jgi:septum formation protein